MTALALDRVVLTRRQIQNVVGQMAVRIDSEYASRTLPLCLVPILDGAFYFASDLSRELLAPHLVKFVSYHSYEGAARRHGRFEAPPPAVTGLDVIVVDTIVDSGATMKAVIENLTLSCPKSIRSCGLIVRKGSIRPDFFGHVYEGEEFLYGYGLDLDGTFRHLSMISYIPKPAEMAA